MAIRRELVRHDMPRLARALAQRHVDVSAVQRTKRDDVDLSAGLEDDDGLIEEGDRGVPAQTRANAIALAHDLTGRRCGVLATRAAVLDVALEDRELTARREATRGRREEHTDARREEEERRGDRSDEEHGTATLLAAGARGGAERNDLRGRRAERTHDGRIDVSDGRDDDRRVDPREHVLHFAARLLIERVRKRKRRLAATERDEDRVTLLTEAMRQLPRDGRVDRVDHPSRGAANPSSAGIGRLGAWRERHQRTSAHAGQDLRKLNVGDETRADDHRREQLARLSLRNDLIQLLLGDELRGEKRIREGALLLGERRRSDLAALVLLRGAAQDLEHLLRRRVLADVRNGADREREVADARVEREEDDRCARKERFEFARHLETGLPRHRVVEKDQVRLELESFLDTVSSIDGLADDDEVTLRREERADPLSDRQVVVDDEYAGRQFLPCPSSAPTSVGCRSGPSPSGHGASVRFRGMANIRPRADKGRRAVSRFSTHCPRLRQLTRLPATPYSIGTWPRQRSSSSSPIR